MESDDLEPRVEALENQVRDLTAQMRGSKEDAAAARVLAGAADRDVDEMRGEIRDFRKATTAGFNAMRQDFVDLRGEFGVLRDEFADLRGEFGVLRDDFGVLRGEFTDLRQDFGVLRDHVDRGFMEMRGKFDATAAGQQQIVDLLNSIFIEDG
ncbi:hypothetical protein JDV09_20410 [Mycobacterium sp. Y57]|uniref:hypothetical protein n=1 Tax=Mycolicibacterium xanthum TaxID=2796469 RepID=UPI001C8555FA|nr:hypothetical protein [Mycolicibacterium xanthum]MBX7434443.1 hypothetical protein [Mycolicibacterium xanthum]